MFRLYKIPKQSLKNNLKYLNYINILYGLTFFTPYIALYLQQKIFSLSLVALIFSVQTFVTILSEFPSAMFSDIFGRKKTLILAALIRIISFVFLLFANHPAFFILYAIFAGLAQSFRSGTDQSLIYEPCHELKTDKTFQKEIGRYFSLYTIGATVSAIIAGVLSKISLEFTIWVSIIPAALVIYLTMLLKEPHYHKTKTHTLKKHLQILSKEFKSRTTLRTFLFVNSLLVAIFTILQKFTSVYLEFKSIDISSIGYVMALFYLLNTYGYRLSHRFTKKFNNNLTLKFTILAFSLTILLSAISKAYIATFIFLTTGFFYSLMTPIFSEIINSHTNSEIRVTTHSLASILTSIQVVILSILISLSANLITINSVFILLSIIPLVILLSFNKSINKNCS